MQDSPSGQLVHPASAQSVSRRTIVSMAAKFVGGAALSVIAGARLAQVAAAQDDEIILTAAASQVGARPGSAFAQGAAAFAAADQDAGAITQGGISPSGTTVGFIGTTGAPSGGADTSVTEGTGSRGGALEAPCPEERDPTRRSPRCRYPARWLPPPRRSSRGAVAEVVVVLDEMGRTYEPVNESREQFYVIPLLDSSEAFV